MSETGFGSPSYSNNPPAIFDTGFGSPFNSSSRGTGFGSPFDLSLTAVEILGDLFYIGDDGGVRIDLVGNWFNYTEVAPPSLTNMFKVTFIKGITRTLALPAFVGHPTSRGGFVYSNLAQTRLYAYVPPLPKGVYDIEIAYDYDNAHQKILIEDAFEVISRNRSLGEYTIRSLLPSHFDAGTRQFAQDDLSKDYTVLETLTRSLGELLQNLTGKPLTKSTSEYNEGDTTLPVESTLGFPASGDLFVEGIHLVYTAKTVNSFTGITRKGRRRETIGKNAKVVYYDNPYK